MRNLAKAGAAIIVFKKLREKVNRLKQEKAAAQSLTSDVFFEFEEAEEAVEGSNE